MDAKRFWSQFGVVMLLVGLLGASAATAAAQALNSGAQAVTLNGVVGEGITISVSSASVNFTLMPASPTNPGSTGVVVATNWNLRPGRNLSLYAFFSSATTALTDGGGNNIPSSAFSISDNGGGFLSVTNSVAFGGAGAGLRLGATTKITGLNKQGTRQDNLLFNIDLSALPQLPAGNYTGVLTLRAQAI